jgi:hypothetical protein
MGPQLAARLAALEGVAPEPVEYVVCRITTLPNGEETTLFHVADEVEPLPQANLPAWLARHRLRGAEKLALALLVVRETLDENGLIRACIIERRRGALDGPLHGEPARVEFTGPARMARVYRVRRDGRLAEVAASTEALPARRHASEQLAGEQRAVSAHFGGDVAIIDAREPTLLESMAGLDSILHVSLAGGHEIGCGIGWHGPLAVVLAADFPRFAAPLALAPQNQAAIQAVMDRDGLVRHETRLDGDGLAVLARRRGGAQLFLLRARGGAVQPEPYEPVPDRDASADQARWMRYAETYEQLAVLDAWHDGDGDDLLVVTGEANGRIWRHHIDRDGVETWRKPDGEAAAGMLYRERLVPGTLAAADPITPEPEPEAGPAMRGSDAAMDTGFFDMPSDSLLAKAEAYVATLAALRGAQDAVAGDMPLAHAVMHLRTLQASLELLEAGFAASEVRVLLEQAEAGRLHPARLGNAVARLAARLPDELAATRLVTLAPPQWRHLVDPVPFGAAVEAVFPEVAYDVEEAALCLAFRRPTAVAFHCMRIVECGLAALGISLAADLPAVDRQWLPVISLLRSTASAGQSSLIAALEQVRRCWRNTRLVPAEKYTEAEAERLFRAVRSFMGELAEHLARRSAG